MAGYPARGIRPWDIPLKSYFDDLIAGIKQYTEAEITRLVALALSNSPELIAAAAAAAQSTAGLARAFPFPTPEFENDEGFIGDQEGRPSKVGFDKQGEVADATMKSAQIKGMARFITSAVSGFRLQGSNGEPTAIGLDSTGQWDDVAHWARVNQDHYCLSDVEPFVWPGNWVWWDHMTSTGDYIETVKVTNF